MTTSGGIADEVGGLTDPIFFMHERSTPSGKKYLVILRGRYQELCTPLFSMYTVSVLFVTPASLTAPATIAQTKGFYWQGEQWVGIGLGNMGFDRFVSLRNGHLRIYAGQADSSDPTHFTIRYSLDDKFSTIDGWVKDGMQLFLTDRR
jgi:hypothetical protein